MSMNSINTIEQQKEKCEFEGYRKRYQWWFLIATLLCEIGYMYNQTAIMTLQSPLLTELELDDFQYNQILLFQYLPGVISSLLSGFLADRFGSAFTFALGIIINYAGQFISTAGVAHSNFSALLAGQLIMTIGTYALLISKIKMLNSWFSTKEIGKALSTTIMIDISAIILCNIGYPSLYQISGSLFVPFIVGTGVILAALPFGVIQITLHSRLLKKHQQIQEQHLDDSLEERLSVWASMKVVLRYPKTFWLLVIFAVASLVSFLCTKWFTTLYLIHQFSLNTGEAHVTLAVALVIAGIVTIMAGIILDTCGRLPLTAILGSTLFIVGLILNMTLPHCNRCIKGGVAFTIISSGALINLLVSALIIMRLIRAPSLGVALGIPLFLTSAMMMFFPTVESIISANTFDSKGYTWVFLLNTGLVVISCLMALIILITDSQGPKRLKAVLPPMRRNSRSTRNSIASIPSENEVHIAVAGALNMKKDANPANENKTHNSSTKDKDFEAGNPNHEIRV